MSTLSTILSVRVVSTALSSLSTSRVLVVGLEPWGVITALDLARAGVGALHVLDDRPVTADDLAAVRFFTAADRGAPRGAVLTGALARLVPGCAVTTGPLVAVAEQPLTLQDTRWDLALACVASDELLVLESVARLADTAQIVSLSAHIDGIEATLGPGVLPGKTACWSCCRLRRLAHSARKGVDRALHAALLAERPRARALPALTPAPALVGHLLAHAALDLLTDPVGAPSAGRILLQNLATLETTQHTVLRMPHCPVCGGGFRAAVPIPPEGNGSDLDDARDPDDLTRMLAGVADDATGIIRRILVRPGDSSLHPEMPVTASAILADDTECTCHGCEPALGSGKGATNLRAIISAVGEAVERYSAGRFDLGRLLRASRNELQRDFVAPDALCPYAEHQRAQADFPFVTIPPEQPIAWAEGFWLDTRSSVLVPALPTFMDFPAPPEESFCEVTSNGLAAGPTLQDAALSAALELLERDAFMISWLARRPGRTILVDASVDADAREAARQLEERGLRVALYLLDVGLGIPAVLCAAYGDGQRWPGATVSLAAHLHPQKAIAKALLEQGHLGPYLCRRVFEEQQPIPQRPEDVHSLEDHALYYVPVERSGSFAFLGAGGAVAAGDLPVPEEVSLDALARRVSAAGLRIAIVDVTSPDLAQTPFRVARALGPSFQQIHFGYGLERLGNPRLCAMAPDGINPDPHPLA